MALKRKGSTVSKDEERVSKRCLRSGRTIETSTSPLRHAKEVLNASAPSNPRVKPFTSTQSAMKIARNVNNENTLDENFNSLPFHLHSCLNAQKRAILRTLQRPSARAGESDNLFAVNEIATRQLADLIEGTTMRAEGNSCILLGPRGSGKSRVSGFFLLLL